MRRWLKVMVKAGGLALTLTLAACGGSGGGTELVTEDEPSSSLDFLAQGGKKLLVVQVDGLGYEYLQEELKQLPELARLNTRLPLRSGGYEGTPTEQPTTALPSWASLLTGVWANEHGISQVHPKTLEFKVDSLFSHLEQKEQEKLSRALVVSEPAYAELLQKESERGVLTLVNCDSDEQCVTEQTQAHIEAGTTVIMAQYQEPLLKATEGLGTKAYQEAVRHTLQDISRLLQRIAEREQADESESWQVLLLDSYGLDAYGVATGSQFIGNKTGWLATDLSVGVLGLTALSGKPVSDLDAAAIVDIVPTVLEYFDVPVDVETYSLAGNSLTVDSKITALGYESNPQNNTLSLHWQLLQSTANAEPIELYRDGILVATLAADAQTYVDKSVGGEKEEQILSYRYLLKKGAALATVNAEYLNIPPVTLDASFKEKLVVYYPFATQPAVDAMQGSTLSPWNNQQSGLSLTPIALEGNAPTFGLAVDTAVHTQGKVAGFKLHLNKDVTTDDSVRAFTIGFWFKVSGTCHGYGTSILANKNYESGNTAGLALGLFNRNGCDIRFNTGDGSSRNEAQGYNVTRNEWAYVALAIDKDKRQLFAYVIDPVLGQQNGVITLDPSKLNALGGAKQSMLSFAEDITGQYTHRNSTVTQSAYADLAIWERALNLDEVLAIYLSRQPLSTLLP